MLPAFFMAHGAPTLAVEHDEYTQLLAELGGRMAPKAILLFSAHWESDTQLVSSVEEYRTIHDFGGFPDELYRISYPARGDAQVSQEVGSLLSRAGIDYQYDRQRGLDHGAWVVARLLYPDARVPVVAMSVNPLLAPQAQYQIGQALADLRARDVLIIASGGTVHNFGTMRMRAGNQADAWAVQFDDWLTDRAAQWDLESLFAYDSLAPNARLAVPAHGREHFIPFFYAMGAADDQRTVKELYRGYRWGNLSHAIWQFGG